MAEVIDQRRLAHIRSVFRPLYRLTQESFRNGEWEEQQPNPAGAYIYAVRIMDFCEWLEDPSEKPEDFAQWYGEDLTMDFLERKCLEYKPHFDEVALNADLRDKNE